MKRLEGKPFVLLGINSDEDRKVAREALAREKHLSRCWWDDGRHDGPISTSYNVPHWPRIFVLDHKGVIRFIDVSEKKLDEAIDQLLSELGKGEKSPPK